MHSLLCWKKYTKFTQKLLDYQDSARPKMASFQINFNIFAYFQTFYEKTGVRVLIICPGLTTTGMASKYMSSKIYAMDLLDDEIAAKEMTTMESQS